MTKHRVAITGLGLVTPCGLGWKPFWEALVEGRSHIRYISNLSLNGFPVKVAGEIPDFNAVDYVRHRKMLKVMSREIQLAVAASHLAMEDANAAALSTETKQRFGISLGTGIINNDLDEVGIGIRNSLDREGRFQMKQFGREGMRSMYPLWFLKYLPNMPACHISIAHGLRGPSNTVTTSSAAGAQAIGEAFHVIRRGDADLMLAGSTDSKVNAMGISRFHLLGLLSKRNHIPAKAYRPFDRGHDGIVLGEGAGLIVLENWEHAKKRGARIYGEVVGYGSSSDYAYDPRTGEDFRGKCLAMTRALHEAAVSPKDVHVIMANGSGLPREDIQEAQAIQTVFQRSLGHLSVTGAKPITGHLVYGAGGVEAAAACLAVFEGRVPPLANLESPAPECELPFAVEKTRAFEGKHLILNSFSFGGQNASIVLRKGN